MGNEYYANAGAGGGGAGTQGDPWTLAEAETFINATMANGDRINLQNSGGSFLTDGVVISVAGATTAPKTVEGCTTTAGDGGIATIERSGGAGYLWDALNKAYWVFKNLLFDGQNGGTYNFLTGTFGLAINIETKNTGTIGGFSGTCINCYSHDNGSYGWQAGYHHQDVMKDNGSIGFYQPSLCFACLSKGNTGNNYHVGTQLDVIQCISDGGSGHGFCIGCGILVNCIIINAPIGKHGINFVYSDSAKAYNCDFYNNDSDTDVAACLINKQTLDPQFKDPANLDYTRIGSSLDDKGFREIGMVSGVDYGIDIGPDQAKFTIPVVGNVRDGIAFGRDANPDTGILDLPAESDVRDGTDYDNATKSGDVELPAEADVRLNTDYGSGGTEYTGELDALIVRDEIEVEASEAEQVEVEVVEA